MVLDKWLTSKELSEAKNKWPGSSVASGVSARRGESQVRDHPRRTTGITPAHPELTRLPRAQGGEAHPPEQEGQCRVDVGRVLLPPP